MRRKGEPSVSMESVGDRKRVCLCEAHPNPAIFSPISVPGLLHGYVPLLPYVRRFRKKE